MTTLEDIHRTVTMRPDTSDELMITASDANGLTGDERELLKRAADELRECYRYMGRLQIDLHEANAHLVATMDRLNETRSKVAALEKQVAAKPASAEPKPDIAPAITWTTLLRGPVLVNGPVYGKPIGG